MTDWYRRVHITGAAGAGKSTLAAALAERTGHAAFDADDYAWTPSDPPFQRRRDPAQAEALFRQAIAGTPRWVLSGQLTRWGHGLTPLFDLVVFLHAPPAVRLARLERRERAVHGPAIEPGGAQHASHQTFMRLAHGYDTGEAPVNTLANARLWLAEVPCKVIEIAGAPALADSLDIVLRA